MIHLFPQFFNFADDLVDIVIFEYTFLFFGVITLADFVILKKPGQIHGIKGTGKDLNSPHPDFMQCCVAHHLSPSHIPNPVQRVVN